MRRTERESRRREELIGGLRRRSEELVGLLSNNNKNNGGGGGGGGSSGGGSMQLGMMEAGAARETEQTAALDNRSILQLQRNLMQGEPARGAGGRGRGRRGGRTRVNECIFVFKISADQLRVAYQTSPQTETETAADSSTPLCPYAFPSAQGPTLPNMSTGTLAWGSCVVALLRCSVAA